MIARCRSSRMTLDSRDSAPSLIGQWHADPAPLCQLVEQVRQNTPGSLSDVADNWFLCALSKRDWAAAEQALAALGDNPCWADNVLQFNRQFGEGLLARAMRR